MNPTPTHRFSLRSEGGGRELVQLARGDVVTVGRDARNQTQIGHGSIEPFHARLRCDDWGVWVTPLPGASVAVAGERTTEERAVPLQATLELGTLRFELAPLAPAAAPQRHGATRRALTHAFAMLASAAMHLLALWILRHFALGREIEPQALALHTDALTPPPEELVAAPEPLPPEPVVEPEPEVDVEPLDQLPPRDPDPVETPASLLSDFEAPLRVGLGNSGGATLSGSGTLSLEDASGLSHGFVSRLRALRGSGVDLVFVIDATSSMRPFLEGARAAADTLVSTLATVVADLRVGVVAYRDAGDDFTTRVLPLTGDRYAILNFLWSLRAEGGGDIPEAVAAGLEAAIEEAGWRTRVHRVIVVVGDAPPHEKEWPQIKRAAARFARADQIPGAVISAIYTGAPRETVASPEEDGAAALAELARLGRGDFLDLGGYAAVGERLLVLTLGPRHANELSTLPSRVRDGPREQMVKKRVAEGDRTWLLAKLRVAPVHPAVVEALIELADRTVLWEARKLVADPGARREVREAALFLLRRCLPPAGEIDLDREPEAQRAVLNRVDALILRR